MLLPGSKPKPLTSEGRAQLFGRFTWQPDPQPGNPENIKMLDSWAAVSIEKVLLPASITRDGHSVAWVHKMVAPHFLALVKAWEDAGVAADVLTWNGAYNARLIRGSTTTLSAHSHGSAFDINVSWNQLGQPPAALGAKGSVARLVPIAESLGWYWGGRFSRVDGQHFEATAAMFGR